ncbi:hypothetical protein KPH14_009619 [Odynerus spinipes]|uniref:CS domain-containing protein n=1 Tax=Odynerus spinipes TaxID=1348599 RepID=A0AAD9RQ37_9HYME|nr:hypothetical protein KPH14_009619 [Odynerus spinipes]
MPVIIIKDYTWRQTLDYVIIYVPFKRRPKKVDFLVIDNYIKASCPPFMLELFLWANIIDQESSCTLDEDKVIFSLRKTDVGLEWPKLELDELDKDVKQSYRDRAIERIQTITKEREKNESEKRHYLQREAVRVQIDLDTAVLNKISAMRDSHRREAMEQLEDWRSKAEIPMLKDEQGTTQKNLKAYNRPITDSEILSNETNGSERGRNDEELQGGCNEPDRSELLYKDEFSKQENRSIGSSEIGSDTRHDSESIVIKESNVSTDSESNSDVESYHKGINDETLRKPSSKKIHGRGKELIDKILNGKLRRLNKIFDEPTKAIPLPRKSGTINITFSERSFPTPARESHQLEEQEWLEKQAEARRQTGFVAEDLRPEERDPQWLKDKGDEFFKAGNHLGAISAYSHGIKLSDKMASLYVNRSAAQYALGNYYRCVEDCSKALQLMEPKCEANRESRARCHARQGAALCKLSAPQHGIPELEAALKLAPDNESIKRDLFVAKQYYNIKD